MLVHFERWSHRYDEWIYWDSNRLRPLERPSLRKEGLKDDDEFIVSVYFSPYENIFIWKSWVIIINTLSWKAEK